MTTICGDPGIQKLTFVIFYEYFFAKALELKVICKHELFFDSYLELLKLLTLNIYTSQLLAKTLG